MEEATSEEMRQAPAAPMLQELSYAQRKLQPSSPHPNFREEDVLAEGCYVSREHNVAATGTGRVPCSSLSYPAQTFGGGVPAAIYLNKE